jgi:hypothetical protein
LIEHDPAGESDTVLLPDEVLEVLKVPAPMLVDGTYPGGRFTDDGRAKFIACGFHSMMHIFGSDVRELLHDGHPTACVNDAAFAYVNAFKAHVNVGFFRGAEIADPEGLLEGTGRFMRHVKLKPGSDVDASALKRLIDTAYTDMRERLQAG